MPFWRRSPALERAPCARVAAPRRRAAHRPAHAPRLLLQLGRVEDLVDDALDEALGVLLRRHGGDALPIGALEPHLGEALEALAAEARADKEAAVRAANEEKARAQADASRAQAERDASSAWAAKAC